MPDSDEGTSLLNLPGFALRRAANAMMGRLAEELSALDLRVSDSTVLLLVGERKDLTSSEIGKALDIQRANMVPVLARLSDAGLVVRVPIDRKSQAIVLTDAGQAKLGQARAVVDRFEADLLARIPDRHRRHFLPALLALIGPD